MKTDQRPVGLEHQAHFFLRAGGAAFDEAADREAMIVAIDQLAAKFGLLASS